MIRPQWLLKRSAGVLAFAGLASSPFLAAAEESRPRAAEEAPCPEYDAARLQSGEDEETKRRQRPDVTSPVSGGGTVREPTEVTGGTSPSMAGSAFEPEEEEEEAAAEEPSPEEIERQSGERPDCP